MSCVCVTHGVFGNTGIVSFSFPQLTVFSDLESAKDQCLLGLHPSFRPVCRLASINPAVISIDLGFYGVEEADERKKLPTLNTGLPIDSLYYKISAILQDDSHPFKNHLLSALSRQGQLL